MNTTPHLDYPFLPTVDKIEQGVMLILEGLQQYYGLDVTSPDFVDTPKRVARSYKEAFKGLRDTEGQVHEILATAFPCDSSEMVIVKGIRVSSMCPHHMLPVLLEVKVGYIPEKGGGVLGLSKMARLVEVLARRPVKQEQFTHDITKHLMTLKGCLGAGALVSGQHLCMMIRGVQQLNSTTITSSMRGFFEEEDATRQEFLSLARGGG